MPRRPPRQIPVEDRPSPNHNARQTPIDMIVLHFTGMSSLDDVLQKLCDPKSELSAHYVVAEDGRIFRLVPEDRRAWHAGVSSWQGQRDTNSRSIGIEIMNNGATDYTHAQITSVMAICRGLMQRYDIPTYNVVGHSDVAPGRKVDPGALFPWTRLSMHGIGLFPDPTLQDYFVAATRRGDVGYIRQLLTQLGYGQDYSPNPTPPLREMIAAFQLRWESDAHLFDDRKGMPTTRTLAMMRALVREQEKAEAAFRQQLQKKQAPPRPPQP